VEEDMIWAERMAAMEGYYWTVEGLLAEIERIRAMYAESLDAVQQLRARNIELNAELVAAVRNVEALEQRLKKELAGGPVGWSS
jgi:hypothetical protein